MLAELLRPRRTQPSSGFRDFATTGAHRSAPQPASQDPPPVLLRRKPRDRHNCCPARYRSHRLSMSYRWSVMLELVAAQCPSGGREGGSNGFSPVATRAGAWPNGGPAAPWHRRHAPRSAASRSMRSKRPDLSRVRPDCLKCRTAIALERVRRNAKSLITANGGEKLPR